MSKRNQEQEISITRPDCCELNTCCFVPVCNSVIGAKENKQVDHLSGKFSVFIVLSHVTAVQMVKICKSSFFNILFTSLQTKQGGDHLLIFENEKKKTTLNKKMQLRAILLFGQRDVCFVGQSADYQYNTYVGSFVHGKKSLRVLILLS